MCETVANITVLYGRKSGRWDTHTGTSEGHYTNELYKSYDRIHHLPYYCTDYISVCLKIHYYRQSQILFFGGSLTISML